MEEYGSYKLGFWSRARPQERDTEAKKRKEKKRAEENEKDWKMTREESEGLRNFDERRGEGAGSENMGG